MFGFLNGPRSPQCLCGSMVEHWSPASEDLRFDTIPHVVSEFFSLRHADKTKNLSLYFFTELKTYHISYSIYNIF